MIERLKTYWLSHGQKTLASALGALAAIDLAGYQTEVEAFIGHKGYCGLRLSLAGLILWRAAQVKRADTP